MSDKRRALGRGLGALISGDGALSRTTPASAPPAPHQAPTQNRVYEEEPLKPSDQGLYAKLPVDRIDPNPEQPRRRFDPGELESLASSIMQHGVLQPVVVRRVDDRFELIVGERRWRASRAAGLSTIPAVVAELTAQTRLEVAIVENVQRHDLNPLELAHAYRALADGGCTQEEIGRKVSQDRSSIANHLRLLELSRDIQEDLEEGRLSMGHAKALLQLPNDPERGRLRDQIIKQGLSVRAAEKSARSGGKSPKASEKGATPVDPNLAQALDAVQRRFQAKVRLKGGAEKGRIEIDYFDPEDFERILSLLMGND